MYSNITTHLINKNGSKYWNLIHLDIVHEPNQGESKTGKEGLAAFMADMDRCYSEELKEIILYSSIDPDKISASFVVMEFTNRVKMDFLKLKDNLIPYLQLLF